MEIRKVTLMTHKLKEMKEFYLNGLGFKLVSDDVSAFTIQAGKSELTFINEQGVRKPFYHFAFTIPAELFLSAKKWAEKRVKLNRDKGADEVTFNRGRSIYFEDPAGNIVEFYARNCFHAEADAFSIDEIIEISEINLTVNQVVRTGGVLVNLGFTHIDEGPLSETSLNFIGSPDVYFLVGPIGRVWFFSDKKAESHPVRVELVDRTVVSVDEKGDMVATKY
ncbi:VOC family protein [Pullulanibacillus sp. KACC 23026]|uniref:VOC family protein n=1 Tax=Pullulanibacillus sp. KACC 23026 TaxID=3028315 RepID=UPI0023B1AE37|nr:VOC family protein [Pullulanibacillus sp. KACC 23026]WEG11297.1 VOC family protein [Pullulanibacillus sp. KACC 23026]